MKTQKDPTLSLTCRDELASLNLPAGRQGFRRSGQSLMETIIGLAIGALLVAAAAFAIYSILSANLTLQKSQGASALNQGLMDRVHWYVSGDWQKLQGIAKGPSSPYFVISSGSDPFAVPGKEGMLDNDVRAGLAAEWSFDESGGIIAYDIATSSKNGILTNDPTRVTSTCAIGSCLSFVRQDDEYVDAGNVSSLKTNTMTVTAWVKPSELNNNRVYSSVASLDQAGWNPNNGQHQRDSITILSDGRVRGFISSYVCVGGASSIDIPVESVDRVSAGQWFFVAQVLDYAGATVQLYLNGVSQGQAAVSGVSCTSDFNYLWIGRRKTANNMEGMIDDVRVYHRALSVDEIRRIYESNRFTQYFYVEDVCRTTDANGTVAGAPPCGGGTALDPSTKSVAAVTEWEGRQRQGVLQSSELLTRAANSVIWQTDWSGGTVAGPLMEAGNASATSTDIDVTSGGSLRVRGF